MRGLYKIPWNSSIVIIIPEWWLKPSKTKTNIYIYGSKLAQSFSKTTKSRHSLYDAPLISGLYSRLALKHGGRVGESRREGHFSFNGENSFYCEVKESCSFPSLHFCWLLLNKISVPVQTVAGRSFSQRTMCRANYYLVYSCVTYSWTSFSTLILSL